ncbi:MAG: InlB B-repeat-containing protein, partial [Lachnospiraceae bacterium]|nr:InlB B-repeat-containing protein [Lachnospiraceae bacterium]
MKKIFRVSFYFFIAVFALTIAKTVRAEGIPPELPSPDAVLQSYRDNPYLRFYEGNEGIAWTTVHPGGYAVTGNGTYIYAGGQSIYRGEEGTTVVPPGVVTRREIAGELPYGHHYYAAPVTDSVIPVGKWVLEHNDARCVHGPFDACSGYEYYGISGLSNVKCGEAYDSGWIAYCADCGAPLTGYVYTCADCVSRIGYIFAGSGAFSFHYPAEYLFICPLRGDNLENDHSMRSHMCRSFISCNRYNVVYDGNGAAYGEMENSVFYYGGEDIYEGVPVEGAEHLRENTFVRTGYRFCGWSDSPDGQVIFPDRAARENLESYFTSLKASGDGSDDSSVILYAVWKESSSVLMVSGGSCGESLGAYNGVQSGSFSDGLNRYEKGYMYETYVASGDLEAPRGYTVRLNAMQGTSASEVYASCELAGWYFESSDPDAREVSYGGAGDAALSGKSSGSIRSVSSDGSFIYCHTSVLNGNTDHVTAQWRSTSVILPGAVCRGMIFAGWYTEPDMKEEHFAGREGDLFSPEHDTELYACFTGIGLLAVPDYMGNDSFGALRYNGLTALAVPDAPGKDVFRYYISPGIMPYDFSECAWGTEDHEEGAAERVYLGEGRCSYLTVS